METIEWSLKEGINNVYIVEKVVHYNYGVLLQSFWIILKTLNTVFNHFDWRDSSSSRAQAAEDHPGRTGK